MTRPRDRLKILYDILKAINDVRGGCLYISVVRKTAELGTPQYSPYNDRAERYFDTLKDFGMIIVASPQGKREATITKKGKAFMFYYERILDLFDGYNYA
jgi:predicted transcriptional regulator